MMINAPMSASIEDEEIQDLVGAMVGGGSSQSDIVVSYDDPNGELDFSVESTYSPTNYVASTDALTDHLTGIDTSLGALGAPPTQEQIEDYVGAMVGGSSVQTNITVSYDDTNGELDFEVEGVQTTINVKDYGATGDGVTDDRTAIQNALNAVSSTLGGRVFLPAGSYRISDYLTITYDGTELVGEGVPGNFLQGTSRIIVDASKDGIYANWVSPSSHMTKGYTFKRFALIATDGSGGGNGICISDVEGSIFEDVLIKDFEAGTGLTIDTQIGGGNAVFTEIRNIQIRDCLKGIYLKGGTSGTRICGGSIQGLADTGPRGGSIGIHIASGDGNRLTNVMTEWWDIGIKHEGSFGNEIYGHRSEACENHLYIGASVNRFAMYGGQYTTGSLPSGEDTGIYIADGAQHIILMPTYLDCYDALDDNSTRGLYIWSHASESMLAIDGVLSQTGVAYGNIVTLADAAPIAVDMADGCNFTVTTTQARAMGNPSNINAGQSGVFIIKGGYAITWGNKYFFPGGTAPDVTGGTAIIPYFCESSSVIYCGAGLLAMAATS